MRQAAALHEAMARHAWGSAFEILSGSDRREPLGPEDLERLALAAHMTGEDAVSSDAWTRAHHAWLSRGEVPRAVRCVFWLCIALTLGGQRAHSAGWTARARRLLDAEVQTQGEEGYLLAVEGLQHFASGEAAAARAISERAVAQASRLGDPDLLTFSLVTLGESLVRLNAVPQGVRLLDEAMTAVTAGEVSPIVSGLAYCAVIAVCREVHDLRRAGEWTDDLTRWCDAQQDLVPYRGVCLAHRVEIIRLHGNWTGAMAEAHRACRWMRATRSAQSSDAVFYQLGELHRLRGEYAEAENAYREASRRGHITQPGLALTLLARGDSRGAEQCVRTALDGTVDWAARCLLLPAAVEIALAAGEAADAADAAAELASTAATVDTSWLDALSSHATGAVLLAQGDAAGARAALRESVKLFLELDAPYEAARARLLLGVSFRASGEEVAARWEVEEATRVFRELGAATDLLRAQELAVGAAPASSGRLTARELEVLRHVAAGKTNRAIAEDLFLSEKTVARHLSNIFAKIGVSSRSAATAYAHQNDLVNPRQPG
ncbi:LuxR C-terminal-related transcriptional regulator [Streptomyces sp. NPDC006879]|uniref:LuxR C-terminal-related transcriptional regulator n=1 Tax=Streptomyces sp. NPDC006879 TaxID=3364767 RepID=UPI0036BBA9A0